jgi:hypothetical protein
VSRVTALFVGGCRGEVIMIVLGIKFQYGVAFSHGDDIQEDGVGLLCWWIEKRARRLRSKP